MKRFDFPLERVRRWRRTQEEIEEARLARLHQDLLAIEAKQAALERELQEAERSAVADAETFATMLHSLEAYRLWARDRGGRLEAERSGCRARIAAQQNAVLEARRRFRLLDLLKNRARTEWTAEMAREVEALSAEAYIAQWGRQRK